MNDPLSPVGHPAPEAVGKPPAVAFEWQRSAAMAQSTLTDIHGKEVGGFEPGRVVTSQSETAVEALSALSVNEWLGLNDLVPNSRLGEMLLAYASWTPRLRLTEGALDAGALEASSLLGEVPALVDVTVAGDVL